MAGQSKMTEIGEVTSLKAWLKDKPPEFGCALAARSALRVVPLWKEALHNEETARRAEILLPAFRTLAAANFACAWHGRAVEILEVARATARGVSEAIQETSTSLQLGIVELTEVMGDEIPLAIADMEANARSFFVAELAFEAAVHAVQAANDAVNAARGIARPDASIEAAASAVVAAHDAVDRFHGGHELLPTLNDEDEDHTDLPPHIAELWESVERDAEFLDTSDGKIGMADVVLGLSEMELWVTGIPVWAGRRWADLKDELPKDEGWQVWTDWYEGRLVGRSADESLEFKRLTIPEKDWARGPSHVNAEINRLIEEKTDPLVLAITHGFDELDAVKEVIDLTPYVNRIRNALPNDPSHVIGTTKEMLEATMKTILRRRGIEEKGNISFPDLLTRCLAELRLTGTSPPGTEIEGYQRKIISSAKKMVEAANELRNRAGTGHGRVIGEEPVVSAEDANLVASTGLILAAWLLRHESKP